MRLSFNYTDKNSDRSNQLFLLISFLGIQTTYKQYKPHGRLKT